MIPDQTKMWNQKHATGDHEKLRGVPSPLAVLVEDRFPTNSYILELGCGVGRDAVYFAAKGHTIVATDSSGVVIHQNKEGMSHPNIKFAVIDMQQPLPYAGNTFDVVFANLSLHYYYDKQTRQIIKDIARVLKSGGVLAFACKSRDDIRTKDAKELKKNVFVAPNGHAIHLFSTEYAKDLVSGLFDILHLDEIEEEYNGRVSEIVRCVAKKKKA